MRARAAAEVVRLALVVVMIAGCASGAKLAKMPNAKPIPDATIRAICKSQYGGDGASIQVWREKDGTFVVFELRPDAKKPDAPTTFFDDLPQEVLRVSSHEGSAGSPQALEDERKRETVTLQGRKAEIIPCKGK